MNVPVAADTILRAYRVRLEPTAEQRRLFARAAGSARAAYNWALANWRREYRAHTLAAKAPDRARRLLERWGSPLASDARWTNPPGAKPTAYSLHKLLNAVKVDQMPWLDEAPSHAVREAVIDVGNAYSHFFRRLKEGKVGREAGAPRFRSRQGRRAFHMDEGKALRIRSDGVRLQKLGWIKIHPHQHGYLPESTYDAATNAWSGAKICGIGISEHLGHWYAAVRVEVPRPRSKPRRPGTRLGVEVGVRALTVQSDGKSVLDQRGKPIPLLGRAQACIDSHNRRLRSAERRLALWSRRMARRHRKSVQQQSAGFIEAKSRVQHVHAEIANIRDELLHYTANRAVQTCAETIVMREPAVKTMIGKADKSGEAARARNRLAPMVSKLGWYELRRKTEYKQRWAGGSFLEVPASVATSRICSECGETRDTPTAYPDFVCLVCGHTEDRDGNSSKVLKDYRPPSGEPVGGGGTPRRKTGRKAGTTTEGTGTVGSAGQPAVTAPDGDATSPLGLGKRAPAQAGETDAVICDPTASPGEPGARLSIRIADAARGERLGDEPDATEQVREVRDGPELPEASRSQSAHQIAGIAGA